MLTFSGVPQVPLSRETSLTIGVLDGVHRGHAALIRRVVERARSAGCLAGAVTFDPHPLAVLAPHVQLRYLGDLDDRLARLEALDVDFVVVVPFTRELSQTSARDFVRPLVERLRMRHLVIGHDFTLGHKRQGNEAFLRSLGEEWHFAVEAIEPVSNGGTVASSTRIRQLLASGSVVAANEMLGRRYAVQGVLGADREFTVHERRQLPGNGFYQGVAREGNRRLPCSVEVRADRLRVLWSWLSTGPATVEFLRDATAEPEGFTEVAHTADVALRVRAASFGELLRQAALGMMTLMSDVPPGFETAMQRLSVNHPSDQDALLVDFLSELLVLCETQHLLIADVAVSEKDDGSFEFAVAAAPAKSLRRQIKAVTYHGLRVIRSSRGLEATIVFDI